MVQKATVERLKKARALKVGCPWELPEYEPPSGGGPSPWLAWSGDVWDASRAYLDSLVAMTHAVEELDRMANLGGIPVQERKRLGDLAGTLRAALSQ